MGNGAHVLIQTLLNAGVDTCFTNPGTSEMYFVAALDDADMRGVLCLFEGVASGAADGYARMADKPAATLLHLGCGLGNALANLGSAYLRVGQVEKAIRVLEQSRRIGKEIKDPEIVRVSQAQLDRLRGQASSDS